MTDKEGAWGGRVPPSAESTKDESLGCALILAGFMVAFILIAVIAVATR